MCLCVCMATLMAACQARTVPDEALFGSNAYLAEAVDSAVRSRVGDNASAADCIRPNPGFARERCVLVRWDRRIPPCPEQAYDRGECYALEIRQSLLSRPLVANVIETASREFCVYANRAGESGAGRVESAFEIGCLRPPVADLKLTHRTAPVTICVTSLSSGAEERALETFVVRGGERVPTDSWCRELFNTPR
jgi:hypothetical protein